MEGDDAVELAVCRVELQRVFDDEVALGAALAGSFDHVFGEIEGGDVVAVIGVVCGEEAGTAAEIEDFFAGEGSVELLKERIAEDVGEVVFGVGSSVGDRKRVVVSGEVKGESIDGILGFFHELLVIWQGYATGLELGSLVFVARFLAATSCVY